ncbi:ATP-grasp domain-containing protein [Pseudonocardia nigra]|uniref:ATP-grasp domain-containing protein n=1 Tax=Pseudonocardia nigra TaxID=1921578 RepID=UPI0027E35979|nr:ATP-grasp domain-containing protein [Pseudonocardia nigra]
MEPTNVFVLGLDDANLEALREVPRADEYRFHPLLSIAELQHGEIPIVELLDKAQAQLEAFAADEGRIDAIVGFWDFPVSSMVPILCRRFGLPGADLEAIVKCEHKYWSRLEQRKAIDALPRFAVVDLEGDPKPPADLRYPMWLKPVKGFSSELAFQLEDDDQFASAAAEIREGIGRVGGPFQWVLDQLDLPPEIADVSGTSCLAEEALTGNQVATEGYVHNGRIEVYGVLDSLTYPGSSVFLRHQYPSQLPAEVTQRLRELSERVIAQIGLDNATFSIEFFHDPATGDINLLEINPRHSQSHAMLFADVDGAPNHQAMLNLALGRDPQLPHRQGRYGIAAKWYHRRFSDGIVRRVPTSEEIERIQRDIPGVALHPVPEQGQRLSEMDAQDSYSFELTDVVVGARDVAELEDRYERAIAALQYDIEDIEDVGDIEDTEEGNR